MKPWLVLLTRFDSGVHYILFVRAKTERAAENKVCRAFSSGKTDDMVSAFSVSDMVTLLQEQADDILEIQTL